MNGDLIYEQGQNADYVYFMFKGSLNLFVDISYYLKLREHGNAHHNDRDYH
jgi:hypothetical protein